MFRAIFIIPIFLVLIPNVFANSKTLYFSQYYQEEDGKPVKFYHSVGGRIMRKGDDELSFIVTDHLASTTLITDKNGAKVGEMSYYPYGSTLSSQGDIRTEKKFTGQILDDSTELYFYNARYYNPLTGRFISADTVQGPNRYAYAANNPIMFTDPSGNAVDPDGGGGGGGGNGLEITISGMSTDLPGITATTPINFTITYDPLNPDPSYYDPYTPGEFERAIVGMFAFSSATVTGVLSIPVVASYLKFLVDYYYRYNPLYSEPDISKDLQFFEDYYRFRERVIAERLRVSQLKLTDAEAIKEISLGLREKWWTAKDIGDVVGYSELKMSRLLKEWGDPLKGHYGMSQVHQVSWKRVWDLFQGGYTDSEIAGITQLERLGGGRGDGYSAFTIQALRRQFAEQGGWLPTLPTEPEFRTVFIKARDILQGK